MVRPRRIVKNGIQVRWASNKNPRFRGVFKWCAQQESNLYLQLRRLTLYPLSYGRLNRIFLLRISCYLIILTFLFLHFNRISRGGYARRKLQLYYIILPPRAAALNCYNNHMKEEKTGTYVYDKKSGKMVKVSDRIPSVRKSGGHACGGCCGHCHCHDD